MREILNEPALATLAFVERRGRAATHREVFTADRDGAPVNFAEPHDIRCRHNVFERSAVILFGTG